MSDNGTVLITVGSEPADGSIDAGDVKFWMASNGHLMSKISDNTVTDMGASATVYSTFTSLTDTPSTLTGQGDKVIKVNSGGTALEFLDAAPQWEQNGEGIRPANNAEIAVGQFDAGRESVFGEGDSHQTGMVVLDYDGSTYTDITSDVTTQGDGNYAELSDLTTGSALYIGNTSNGGLWYSGLKMNTTQAMIEGGGSLVREYYNGSAWVEFTAMTTNSDFPYASHGNVLFDDTGSHQIRYNHFLSDDWAKTTIDSKNIYWTRYRVASTITQSFRFDFLKLHTSRTEINAEGFMEFFGWARNVKQFFLTYGSFQAASASPSNLDISISDNVGVGRVENYFASNAIDRSGFTKILPLDMDTSTPLKLRFKYFVTSSSSGNIQFIIRWGLTRTGSDVYAETDGPPTGVGEQSMTAVIPVASNSDEKEITQDVYLPIEDAIPEISSTEAESIWVTFERTGSAGADTYPGNAAMIDVECYYISWRNGGMVVNY